MLSRSYLTSDNILELHEPICFCPWSSCSLNILPKLGEELHKVVQLNRLVHPGHGECVGLVQYRTYQARISLAPPQGILVKSYGVLFTGHCYTVTAIKLIDSRQVRYGQNTISWIHMQGG